MKLIKPDTMFDKIELNLSAGYASNTTKSFTTTPDLELDTSYICKYSFPDILLTKSLITLSYYFIQMETYDKMPSGVYIHDLTDHEITLGIRPINNVIPQIRTSFMIYQSPNIVQTTFIKHKWRQDLLIPAEGYICQTGSPNHIKTSKSITQIFSSTPSRTSIGNPFITSYSDYGYNVSFPNHVLAFGDQTAKLNDMTNTMISLLITEFK
mgnify:CR=1 FL=1